MRELREFAGEIGIDYYLDKNLPRNSVWLSRKINTIKQDLKVAGLTVEETKGNKRLIWFRKDYKTYDGQQYEQKKLDELEDAS